MTPLQSRPEDFEYLPQAVRESRLLRVPEDVIQVCLCLQRTEGTLALEGLHETNRQNRLASGIVPVSKVKPKVFVIDDDACVRESLEA